MEPLITTLLNDANEFIRIRAVVALGKIKDQRAIEPLIYALKNINKYRGGASIVVSALQEITGENYGKDIKKWERWWEKNKTK